MLAERILLPAAVVALLSAPAVAQGIVVGDGALRVETLSVDASVDEGVAAVTVEETFRSDLDRTEEGIYRFELPEDAVIGSFSLWIDGKERRGRVLDAGDARRTYDAIVGRRRDPGLLEQTGWRSFTLNVFPIAPRGVVRTRLSYAHVVPGEPGGQRLQIALPRECGPVGGASVHVTVGAAHGRAALECPGRADAHVALREDGGAVRLGGDGVVFDGPLDVRIRPRPARAGDFDVTLVADREAESTDGWFVARVLPNGADLAALPRDLVFVVDTSGSMVGAKIEQARAALLAGIDSLREGDRFDVVSFASEVACLGGSGLLPADAASRSTARRFAGKLEATGGTDLAGGLAAAQKELDPQPGRLAAIVLLTDGMPTVGETSPDRILATWRKSAGAVRLFAFGVGDDVKDFLLTRLSIEGRGEATYVRDDRNLESALATLIARLRRPLLLEPNLAIEGKGVAVTDLEPRRAPDLFEQRAWIVTGRFHGAGAATIRLKGRGAAGGVALEIPVEFPETAVRRPFLAQIWAKRRIDRLLDELRAAEGNDELKSEIRRLGLTHQIVTPYTSYLVVEEGVKLAEGVRSGGLDPSPVAESGDDVRVPAADATVSGGHGYRGSGVSAFASRRAGGGGGGRRSGFATEAVIDSSLLWLIRRQQPDGRFEPEPGTNGPAAQAAASPVATPTAVEATALCVLALLGDGNTHVDGHLRRNTKDALLWLRANQDDEGCFCARRAPGFLRAHALAALAMTEAYALTQAGAFRESARNAVGFALSRRTEGGGFLLADGRLDVATTGWMALFLRHARRAGLDVDENLFDGLVAAIDPLTDRASGLVTLPPSDRSLVSPETATAIGALLRALAGRRGNRDETLRAELAFLHANPPATDRADGRRDDSYLQFATAALLEAEDDLSAWTTALGKVVVSRSDAAGAADLAGSFEPADPDRLGLGRLGSTALTMLLREVYYRCPRVYLSRSR